MLNAGGGWYELSNGGHLMIIKSASQRLYWRHGCWSTRTPAIKPAANVTRARVPARGYGRPPKTDTPLSGMAGAWAADDRDQRQLL